MSSFFAVGLLVLAGCATDSQQWRPGIETVTNSVAVFRIGDDVSVTLSGGPQELNVAPHEEPIKEDGTITMPQIGKIKAAGKTAGELQDLIHDMYVPAVYTQITVTVRPGDRVYYVTGEVKDPGYKIYLGAITVTKAITAASDFTDFANRRKVWLTRANGQRFWIDCQEARENPQMDPPVYPGDSIEVKRAWM